MTIAAWALTVLSLIGVVLNIKRQRSCFYVWAAANLGWMFYFMLLSVTGQEIVIHRAGILAQLILFSVYFASSIWGIVAWRPIK